MDSGPKIGPIRAFSTEQEFFEKSGFVQSLTLIKPYLYAKNQENPSISEKKVNIFNLEPKIGSIWAI